MDTETRKLVLKIFSDLLEAYHNDIEKISENFSPYFEELKKQYSPEILIWGNGPGNILYRKTLQKQNAMIDQRKDFLLTDLLKNIFPFNYLTNEQETENQLRLIAVFCLFKGYSGGRIIQDRVTRRMSWILRTLYFTYVDDLKAKFKNYKEVPPTQFFNIRVIKQGDTIEREHAKEIVPEPDMAAARIIRVVLNTAFQHVVVFDTLTEIPRAREAIKKFVSKKVRHDPSSVGISDEKISEVVSLIFSPPPFIMSE